MPENIVLPTTSVQDGEERTREIKNGKYIDDHGKSVDLASSSNISERKIMNSSFESGVCGPITRLKAVELGVQNTVSQSTSNGYGIIDKSVLTEVLTTAAICRACKATNSRLHLKSRGSDGLAEHLYFQCSNCNTEKHFHTSRKLQASERRDNRGGRFSYDVNKRSSMASLPIGHSGLVKFCGVMNLPKPCSRQAHNKSTKKIKDASVTVAEHSMNNAAKQLFEIKEKEEMDQIEWNEERKDNIAKVAVTVDGTWQKRGYTSKHGAVFVMSVKTGEVLDYEVLSMVCFECRAKEKLDKESEEYKQWYANHESSCSINHKGSSGEMESSGASRIFDRSIEKRGLKYTIMVGDGDTGCFGTVAKSLKDKYGDDYNITKEECVGHVQKRMGTSLREYKRKSRGKKLADGKTVGGAGKLTDKTIDSIQNYYGMAIRKNKGNLDGMKIAIDAILKHMVREEGVRLEDQHLYCPKNKGTWCKYWKDMNEKTNEYDDSKRLPSVFRSDLKHIFNRLSDDTLLKRCLLGVTQNQNEALHGVLWRNCPKITFCGRRKIEIASCQTISSFNSGASSIADVMKLCNILPGHNTMLALRKLDHSRIQNAAVKVSDKYKKRRRQLRAKRLKIKDKTKEAYITGGFGLKSLPEYVEEDGKNLSNKKGKAKNKEQDIGVQSTKKRRVADLSKSVDDEPSILFVIPLEEIMIPLQENY